MAEEGSSGSSSGTVNVPGLGSMKRNHVLILVAVAVGVVGYAYWQRGRNAEPVYLDPAELNYGDDLPAGASTTPGIVEYNNTEDDDPTYGAPRTNNEWSSRAIERLSYLNYDGQMVATAIGKYLARQQLSQAEADVIRTIHGLIGRPPEGDYPILLGAGPSARPYVLYHLASSNPPVWALAGGTEKWQEISGVANQGKANSWAAQYMPTKSAISIGQAEWIDKKTEYQK